MRKIGPSIYNSVNQEIERIKLFSKQAALVMLSPDYNTARRSVIFPPGASVGVSTAYSNVIPVGIGTAYCAICHSSMDLSIGVEKAVPSTAGSSDYIFKTEYYDGVKVVCRKHSLAPFYIIGGWD